MKLSRLGAAAIIADEAIILTAYPDPGTGGDPITIGIGHTAAAGGIVPRYGMKWTIRQSLIAFLQDASRFEKRVDAAIRRRKPQNVFDGFASFDFNTGAISSGSVDDKWNSGDEAGAIRVLNAYTKAGGKFMQGLANRRARETALITKGVYPNARILVRDTYKSQGRYLTVDQLPWDEQIVVPVTADIPIPPVPVRKPETPMTVMDYIRRLFGW